MEGMKETAVRSAIAVYGSRFSVLEAAADKLDGLLASCLVRMQERFFLSLCSQWEKGSRLHRVFFLK